MMRYTSYTHSCIQLLAQKPKCHKICLLQYTADSDSSEDEFELTTDEATAVLEVGCACVCDKEHHFASCQLGRRGH